MLLTHTQVVYVFYPQKKSSCNIWNLSLTMSGKQKKKALFLFFAKREYILSSNPQSAIPPPKNPLHPRDSPMLRLVNKKD